MVSFVITSNLSQNIILTSMARNDILRKHGVIPEKPPSPTPLIEEALLEARKQAYDNRLENKGLDELDELEDDEDAEFLEKYRYGQFSNRQLSAPDRAAASNA